jgi:uncharacterized protein (TIGR03437 family)
MIRTLTVVAAAIFSSIANGQTVINTIAGSSTGISGFSGDNAIATAAKLSQPTSIAVDAAGNIYFADAGNARVRMISPSGVITTVAGNGSPGFSGDGGPATAASFNNPVGIAVDAAGNIYIADFIGSIVRKVSGGIVTTIAGKYGLGDEFGDGGLATSAVLFNPSGVAVDASGNVYIADTTNNVIRKITASSGNISIAAGTAHFQGFAGDGGKATAASLNSPTAVAVDAAGNLFIADTGNNRVREVNASNGNISTIAGTGVAGSIGDNGGAATSAQLYKPSGIAVDGAGNVFIASTQTNRVLEISGGNISTVAGNGIAGTFGNGGSPAFAEVNQPKGVAVDAAGNVYIADTLNNRIQKISSVSAPAPIITANGVVPVYSTVSTVQPGEWIAIYGANLGPAAPVNWNGDFPTELGGTSVSIDGIAAYLYYVSAGQVNVQVPDDANIGRAVTVKVTVGSQSVSSNVNLASVAPSFALLGDNLHVAGIILRKDGSGAFGNGVYDIIGPASNSLGYKTVPARAGDNIELFGFGFGPTTPNVPAGQVFNGAASTTNKVTLTIGTTTVVTSFVGISQAGTYQFNLTVPAGLGTGDVAVAASVTGVSTSTGEPGAVIALQ